MAQIMKSPAAGEAAGLRNLSFPSGIDSPNNSHKTAEAQAFPARAAYGQSQARVAA